MANPNIVNVATINGTTTYVVPANTSATTVITNALGSGLIIKVNSVLAANVTATTANVTVSVNSAAAGGGTAYRIAKDIAVPGNASLIVVDKTTAIYLTENQSLVVASGTASSLEFVTSYETIS